MCVQGRGALAAFDPGGLDVLTATLDGVRVRLRSENHTLKRALTDPHLFSGIGNAYSDEILHRAKLSPLALYAEDLDESEVARLLRGDARRARRVDGAAARARRRGEFPAKVTAFRPEMAVHGRFKAAVPGVRRARAAHRVRGERGELLRALPDQWRGARRSRAVAAAAQELPAHARGNVDGDAER